MQMEHLMLTAFTNAQQTQIEALRADLTRRIQRTVTVEYGEDDHGGLWAALNVETLPSGTWGRPGTLVSILAGAGVNGEAAVVAAGADRLVCRGAGVGLARFRRD
mgnify:CR=1 FL=1